MAHTSLSHTQCLTLTSTNCVSRYPLLPPSISPPSATKKSLLRGKKTDKVRESRVAHAYAEASNAFQLGRVYAENRLLKAFVHFEEIDQPGEIDPREARRERWIIIYCILQVLAGIAVDVPYLSFKGAGYFLNARLQGFPPWGRDGEYFENALREQSHCWTTVQSWSDGHYELWASTKMSLSSTKSLASYEKRPLSPDCQRMTSTDSKPSCFAALPFAELEATEVCPTGSDSPVAGPPLSSGGIQKPDQKSLPQKTMAARYITKPLPLRPRR